MDPDSSTCERCITNNIWVHRKYTLIIKMSADNFNEISENNTASQNN